MTERAADPHRLDLRRFARDGARLAGEWPQDHFTRLAASLMPPLADGPAPEVSWAAQGQQRTVQGGQAEVWLHLQVDTVARLECQRCLQPINESLTVDRQLRFVAGEDEAARLDEDSDDDVLALVPRLDLLDLIEDELILALPLVPRHETCPQPLASVAGDLAPVHEEERPHPFAALAALRGKPPAA
jgi:uncharacterized protein